MNSGVDMIILEMLRDPATTDVILAAALEKGLPIWAGFSAVITDGVPMQWSNTHTLADGIRQIREHPIELVAIMHSEIEDIDTCLDVVDELWDGPVGVYAQRGDFDGTNWLFTDTVTPAQHTEINRAWIERGVQVVGGCCGIGPEHIEHMGIELELR